MTIAGQELRDQLARMATKPPMGRSLVRPISQVTVRLDPVAGKDRFSLTVDSILRWIGRRAGRALPREAWNRTSFDLAEVGAQRAAAVAIDDPRYWAARLDDADKAVPQRTWVIEIGVGVADEGQTLFGVRLICASRGLDEPFARTVPSFVREILGQGPANLDGLPVQQRARVVAEASEVLFLLDFLENPKRETDVIVVALPESSADPEAAIVSAKALQAKLLGVAHVFVLTSEASFELTRLVGKELSVFRSAVRVYRPRFRAWFAEPFAHPLVLPHRILTWEDSGAKAFESWIVDAALSASVRRGDREERLPAFNTVRQMAALSERSRAKQSGGTAAEMLELFEQDNEQLRRDLREQRELNDGLLAAADTERAAAVEAAQLAQAQALERAHRIRVLEARLAEGADASAPVAVPEGLDEFEDWCRANLSGSVELVSRAFQGVRKSEFHDPALIYRSLLLLRDRYVPMRIERSSERRESYLSGLAELRLEESATGDGTKYAEDLYSVQYGGGRRSLDRHLKGSSSRDPRYGFRLYFFWDDAGQVVVVGWLPSHLKNRMS